MRFFTWLGESPIRILWLYLIIINIVTFFLMGIDKRKAIKAKWRIPESKLFLFAWLGGSLGGILGIYAFRHKTKHKKFTIGFPLILILQIALGVFIYISVNK